MRTTNRSRRWAAMTRWWLAVGVGLGGAMAAAQDGSMLSGPSVVQDSPPGMEKTFGHALASNPMVVRDSISMTAYSKMLAALEGDLALNNEQAKKSKKLDTGWREHYAAYFATKLPELEAIHAALPEAEAKRMEYLVRSGRRAIDRGWTQGAPMIQLDTTMDDSMSGSMTDSMTGSMSDSMTGTAQGSMAMAGDDAEVSVNTSTGVAVRNASDARALLSRIRRGAPLPWEAQSRIWKLLTKEQQNAMTQQLMAYRLERRLAREQREMQRAAQRSGGEVGPTLLEHRLLLEAAARTGVLAESVFRMLSDEDRDGLESLEVEQRAASVRMLAQSLIAQETRERMSNESEVGTKVETKVRETDDGGKPAPSLETLEFPAVNPTAEEKNIPGATDSAEGPEG